MLDNVVFERKVAERMAKACQEEGSRYGKPSRQVDCLDLEVELVELATNMLSARRGKKLFDHFCEILADCFTTPQMSMLHHIFGLLNRHYEHRYRKTRIVYEVD